MKPNHTLQIILLTAALLCAGTLIYMSSKYSPRSQINAWLAENEPTLETIRTSVPLEEAEPWMWPQVFSLAAKADSLEDLAMMHGALSVRAAGDAEQASSLEHLDRAAFEKAKKKESEEHLKEVKTYIEHFETLKDIKEKAKEIPGINSNGKPVSIDEDLRVFKYNFPYKALTEGPVKHLAFLFKGNKLQQVLDLADPTIIRLSETVDEAIYSSEMDLNGYILELDTALADISE